MSRGPKTTGVHHLDQDADADSDADSRAPRSSHPGRRAEGRAVIAVKPDDTAAG